LNPLETHHSVCQQKKYRMVLQSNYSSRMKQPQPPKKRFGNIQR